MSPEPPLILIVEDSLDIAELFAELFIEEGYQVRIAHTGEQALELLGVTQPAVMTLDIGLPGISGLDVLRAIRADEATRALPVIVISAYAGVEFEVRNLAQGFLRKPCDLDAVLQCVRWLLGMDEPPKACALGA